MKQLARYTKDLKASDYLISKSEQDAYIENLAKMWGYKAKSKGNAQAVTQFLEERIEKLREISLISTPDLSAHDVRELLISYGRTERLREAATERAETLTGILGEMQMPNKRDLETIEQTFNATDGIAPEVRLMLGIINLKEDRQRESNRKALKAHKQLKAMMH